MPTGARRGDMFNKADIKKLYRIPRSQNLSDEERRVKGWFIYNTIIGGDFECKDWHYDFVPFQKRFSPMWDLLYKRRTQSNQTEWAVFEEDRLDFVDDHDRTTATFPYPNTYATATVLPRPTSQSSSSSSWAPINRPPPPQERFAKVTEAVPLSSSELLPTELTPKESLLKLFARWNADKQACAHIKTVDLQIDDTDVSVEIRLQNGTLYAVNGDAAYAVEVAKSSPFSLLYRQSPAEAPPSLRTDAAE